MTATHAKLPFVPSALLHATMAALKVSARAFNPDKVNVLLRCVCQFLWSCLVVDGEAAYSKPNLMHLFKSHILHVYIINHY